MSGGTKRLSRLFARVAILSLAWVTQAPAEQNAPTTRIPGEMPNVIRALLGDELTVH